MRLGQGMVNGAPFYSMDGELLAISTTLGVDLYEARMLRKLNTILDQGKIVWEKPVGWETILTDLAFSPSGELLASGSYDGTVILWGVPSGP